MGGLAELNVILQVLEGDVASTERGHSQNEQRLQAKSYGKAMTLEELSAKFTSRVTSTYDGLLGNDSEEAGSADVADGPPRKGARTDKVQGPVVRVKSGGGGAWRAFWHLNHHGVRLTAKSLGKLRCTMRVLILSRGNITRLLGSWRERLMQQGAIRLAGVPV